MTRDDARRDAERIEREAERCNVDARQLALLQLRGVLESAAWFAACAETVVAANGEVLFAARLTELKSRLTGALGVLLDEAYRPGSTPAPGRFK